MIQDKKIENAKAGKESVRVGCHVAGAGFFRTMTEISDNDIDGVAVEVFGVGVVMHEADNVSDFIATVIEPDFMHFFPAPNGGEWAGMAFYLVVDFVIVCCRHGKILWC